MIEGKYEFKDALLLANDLYLIPSWILTHLEMKEDLNNDLGLQVRYGNDVLQKGDIIYWSKDNKILISKT